MDLVTPVTALGGHGVRGLAACQAARLGRGDLTIKLKRHALGSAH
ncbi:hypothetical protein [Pelomonas aquatica]|jgi:hypothetical protein|nr:hypothetical protein [Pelomonas aquatica]MCY4756412.1 hypothetical protein [Pelomonas aquatica]